MTCFLCRNDPSEECVFCRLKKSAKNFYDKLGQAGEKLAESYQNIRGALSGGDYQPALAAGRGYRPRSYRSSLGFEKGYAEKAKGYNTQSRNSGGGKYG